MIAARGTTFAAPRAMSTDRLRAIHHQVVELEADVHALDGLARTGVPSRAEVTDASMSVQAECVMLHKGAYVVDACRTLDTILRRMEGHQFKKRNLYRPLGISSVGG